MSNNIEIPLVSVIVPYFNHNQYVKKCLDSVLQQDYKNIELIIINDGSNELDSSNLDNWISCNKNKLTLKYFKRENQGICNTLNELIAKSRGAYIGILASDDYLFPESLSSKVAYLEKNKDIGVCLTDAIVVNEKDEVINKSAMFDLGGGNREDYLDGHHINDLILRKWVVVGSTYLIRKDLYDLIGLYDNRLIVEDWDFFLRASLHTKIVFLSKTGSAYRWHSSNTASSKDNRSRIFNDLSRTAARHAFKFKMPNSLYLLCLAIIYKIRVLTGT